ncbi:4-hydroxyphenylpyruvate dioxygenase-like putative hemolysin [Kitasatospora sp. MAP5-34]|nr:4-hydroxyphenylpyruvate dioxygenase-like putative hemolysin [Kitasatospora sp. MAP5-34]
MTDVFAEPLVTSPDEFGPLPVRRTDAVVLAVADARRTARRYATAMAMSCTAYSGPETGNPETASYVLESGGARFVITSVVQVLTDHGRLVAEHVAAHGDGILDLAVEVPDAYAAFDYAVDRGATPITEPYELDDRYGTVVLAVIGTAGTGRHTLVERTAYAGLYLPGYVVPPRSVR